MGSKTLKIKLISAFLVTFVCLNAGGAVCLAYCRADLEISDLKTEHGQGSSEHCGAVNGDLPETSDAVATNEFDCCPMTLSFIGAPFEQKQFSFKTAPLPLVVKTDPVAPESIVDLTTFSSPAYRGPPLDRRVERLKHCIIRI